MGFWLELIILSPYKFILQAYHYWIWSTINKNLFCIFYKIYLDSLWNGWGINYRTTEELWVKTIFKGIQIALKGPFKYYIMPGGVGVYDSALCSITGVWGCGYYCYLIPAFILTDNFILPCRFALIQNGVPASQHLKMIRNGVCCYGSYCRFTVNSTKSCTLVVGAGEGRGGVSSMSIT